MPRHFTPSGGDFDTDMDDDDHAGKNTPETWIVRGARPQDVYSVRQVSQLPAGSGFDSRPYSSRSTIAVRCVQ
jgi:hypothetical protein